MTTRLDPPDRIQLTSLLSDIFAGLDAAGREAFLKQPDLHQFVTTINLNGDSANVCRMVITKLEEYGPLNFWTGYTALGALLWYINTLLEQPYSRRELAARFIIKYALIEDNDYLKTLLNNYPNLQDQSYVNPPAAQQQHHNNIRNALRAGRQNQAQRANERACYEIDEDLLLREFDLELQTTTIHNRLAAAPAYGLLPFFLSGDAQILLKLLIPRVVSYLEERLVRTVANRHEIPLNQADLAADLARPGMAALLDQKLAANYNIELQTLVQQPNIDSLLAIVNVDIPQDKASALAVELLAATEKATQNVLRQHGILFIMLWINSNSYLPAVDQYHCVSPLDKIPEFYVTKWFERKLAETQVTQADIARCVQLLRKKYQLHNGSPRDVYWNMQEIIRDLKYGRLQ